MKIAVFSGTIPSSTFIETLIKGLGEYHEVMLFGVMASKGSYTNKAVTIYQTPTSHWENLIFTGYRTLKLLFRQPKAIIKLLDEVKKYASLYEQWVWYSKFLPIVLYPPDILHLQWTKDLEFYGFLGKQFQMPLVVSLRGSHVNYTPVVQPKVATLYRELFPSVTRFHAVSQAIGEEAQKYGAPPENIKVIHSPIQETTFDFYRPPIKNGQRPLKLVSVGRHHWVKGYVYALLAIAHLRDHLDTICHYTIIAQGEVPEALVFMRHQLGLESLVRFQSGLHQDALFAALQDYDALLLPSLNEGIANVVLEAMALGVPVVSTDCGGMAEVVRPGETGWLVPVRDPEAMAKALLEVMHTSEEALQRIAQNAHDLVKAEFCAERSIQRFLELYDQVVAGVITSEAREK